MPAQLPTFSEKDLIDELRTLLVEFAHSFSNLLPEENWRGLLGISASSNGKSATAQAFEALYELDIDGFPITQVMRRIYQYGVHGVLVEQLLRDWNDVQDNVVAFFDGVRHFPLMDNNTLLIDTSTENSPFWRCETALRLSYLRFHLDHDNFNFRWDHVDDSLGQLTLPDLAFLAGIDEKTVRNLANPKGKEPLVTVKHGSRTYVERDVALEWLKKRGYKETEFRSESPSRDLAQHGFASNQDLASFVQERRLALSLSHEALADLMSGIDRAIEIVQQIESGGWTFPAAPIKALAAPMAALGKALDVDVRQFVMAVHRLCTMEDALQLENLLRQATNPDWGSW